MAERRWEVNAQVGPGFGPYGANRHRGCNRSTPSSKAPAKSSVWLSPGRSPACASASTPAPTRLLRRRSHPVRCSCVAARGGWAPWNGLAEDRDHHRGQGGRPSVTCGSHRWRTLLVLDAFAHIDVSAVAPSRCRRQPPIRASPHWCAERSRLMQRVSSCPVIRGRGLASPVD